MGQLNFIKKTYDDYEELFKSLEVQPELDHLFPIFRNIQVVQQQYYKLVKVTLKGLPNEVSDFMDKWQKRQQMPQLLLIHHYFTNKIDRTVLYFDYPEEPLTFLDESEFLECLDIIVQLMAVWQQNNRYYGYFGRDCIYKVQSQNQKYYWKLIDKEIRPYSTSVYKKCLNQQSIEQLQLILHKFYISPAQLEALAEKKPYPFINQYKNDVFCFALYLLSCLTQRYDFYDLSTFTIQESLITELIEQISIPNKAKQIFKNMLNFNENYRPDFLQLDLQIEHFAFDMHYQRKFLQIQDQIYKPLQIIDSQQANINQVEEEYYNTTQQENIPQEVMAEEHLEMSFEGKSFTLDSETNIGQKPLEFYIHKQKSSLLLNNVIKSKKQQVQTIKSGYQVITRIDLPYLGYHNVKNWKIAEGCLVKDKLEGECKLTFPNDEYFIGQFKNDSANGQGKYYFTNGKCIEGFWLQNEYQIIV